MSDYIKIDDFDSIIVNSLEEVMNEDTNELELSVKAAGKKAVRLLKQRSRKKKRHGGSYAKAWSCHFDSNIMGTSCTVYNKQASLTHLLEKGHAIKNQYGSYQGKVAGDHVIEGVYREVAAEFSKGAQ